MTTLADLKTGDQFLMACQVTSVDPTAGIGLSLFGPAASAAATATIAPTGVMSGQLAVPPNQVPVNVVTGFAPVTVGDVLQNSVTGETMVCRWSQIGASGTVTWAAAPSHQVIYPAQGWTVIGHVSL